MMTSYQSPSYDPYRNISPYANQNSTGVAEEMARRHRELVEMSQSRNIDRMMDEVRYLRHRVDEFDNKFNAPVALYSTYKDPEPSVEIVGNTPSWLSRLWEGFITDPFWEFLKRPSIK